MTATVIPLRLCLCGEPGAPLTIREGFDAEPALAQGRDACRDASVGAGEVLHAYICDACLTKVEARLFSVRPVFNAMIECAVPKEIADEVMTFLLDLLDEDEDGGDEIEK